MTYETDYIADIKGRVYKIDDLDKNKVGSLIREQYQQLQMIKTRLDKLHDRLHFLRNEESTKKVPRTNTSYKLIKELKLKGFLASEEGSKLLHKSFNLESLFQTRTITILRTALKAVEEEADHEYIAAILRQGDV